MIGTTIDYLKGPTGLERVVFCLFGHSDYEIFARQLEQKDAK